MLLLGEALTGMEGCEKEMMKRKGLGFCQKRMATEGRTFIVIIVIIIIIIKR